MAQKQTSKTSTGAARRSLQDVVRPSRRERLTTIFKRIPGGGKARWQDWMTFKDWDYLLESIRRVRDQCKLRQQIAMTPPPVSNKYVDKGCERFAV